ncbi:MAG: hypothetical protein GC150_05635 [Rhizobiales bacterium]|nr:hypothetical protein [Hyphomicrobiales bacterium]
MVAWKRFPVPEYAYEQFRDMSYTAPSLIDAGAVKALADRAKGGDAAACGGHATSMGSDIASKLGFSGEHVHAIACVVPAGGAHLLARSHAWRIQRAVLLEGGDARKPLADWRTPRPMNTRLGPDNGIEIPGGCHLLLLGHKFADGWIASRTIVQNGLDTGNGRKGFRVLANSDDEIDDFHDMSLTFDWKV